MSTVDQGIRPEIRPGNATNPLVNTYGRWGRVRPKWGSAGGEERSVAARTANGPGADGTELDQPATPRWRTDLSVAGAGRARRRLGGRGPRRRRHLGLGRRVPSPAARPGQPPRRTARPARRPALH